MQKTSTMQSLTTSSSLVAYTYSGSVAQQVIVRLLHCARSSAAWTAELTPRLILLRSCSINSSQVNLGRPLGRLHKEGTSFINSCRTWEFSGKRAIWPKTSNLLWRMMVQIGSWAVRRYTSSLLMKLDHLMPHIKRRYFVLKASNWSWSFLVIDHVSVPYKRTGSTYVQNKRTLIERASLEFQILVLREPTALPARPSFFEISRVE